MAELEHRSLIPLPASEHDVGYRLAQLEEKVSNLMTAQDDVNAAVTAVQAVVTDLTGAVDNIKTEIAALQAANVPVNTAGLDAAVAQLQAVQATVDALETPPPPAPAP